MSGSVVAAGGAETAEDFGPAPEGTAARWHAEFDAFDAERTEWRRKLKGIEDRYRDTRAENDKSRRFALLWANVEVLAPTLYARSPSPQVTRRFKDRDPVGRVAAAILERNLAVLVDDEGAFGRTMGAVVKDFLLGGQGAAWVRYDVTMGSEPGPDGMPLPAVSDEAVRVEFVHWQDFGFTAGARVWDEVGCVWRRSFLTREQLRKRFPEVADKVPLDARAPGDEDRAREGKAVFGKATVFEVWDADTRTVTWVHKGMGEPLDERPYPLKLRGKFPCPAPLFGTLTNGSLVPVPDYVHYQDQALELDTLTGRIAALTSFVQAKGFYPADMAEELNDLLHKAGDGDLIPLRNWSAMQGQKLGDAVAWLPMREAVETLTGLVELRERVKQDAYEVTGLSDILRGQSQASETATAQQIKAQWGSIRVRTRQQDVQRFAAELLNLSAEVMCGHFEGERLARRACVEGFSAEDQQLVPDALALLQGDGALMAYRVDVETDSTVEGDAAADKAAWSELLGGVSSFLGAMSPLLQGISATAPQAAVPFAAMTGELLTGAVRRFRAGPGVEASIEAAFAALGQAAAQPPTPQGPPPPDPLAVAEMELAGRKQDVAEQVAAAGVKDRQDRTALDAARVQLAAGRMQAGLGAEGGEMAPGGVF